MSEYRPASAGCSLAWIPFAKAGSSTSAMYTRRATSPTVSALVRLSLGRSCFAICSEKVLSRSTLTAAIESERANSLMARVAPTPAIATGAAGWAVTRGRVAADAEAGASAETKTATRSAGVALGCIDPPFLHLDDEANAESSRRERLLALRAQILEGEECRPLQESRDRSRPRVLRATRGGPATLPPFWRTKAYPSDLRQAKTL